MKLRKWIYLLLILGLFVSVKATKFQIEDANNNIVAWFNQTGSINITEDLICPSCINPEDVNDIDDAQIETDLNTYVDIAGDDMAGDLTSTGFINSTKGMGLKDNDKLYFGTDDDWCIFFDGTNLKITNSC